MTREQLEILARVSKDPWFFSTFAYVVHPVRGRVSFDLYPFQKGVLWNFMFKQFVIIVKCRQMGLTELLGFYVLWLAMYHGYKNILLISLKDRVAKKLLRRIKHIYQNLPEFLKVPVINGRPGDLGTASEMIFINNSSITSIPTTEDAGRSEAVSLLVMDEAAIMQYAEVIWTAAFPTLSTGGSAIVNSCVTGDTEIIGRYSNFRIDTICPKNFGVTDLRFLNLEVLSHTGAWRRVLGSVNKGELLTWEVVDSMGNSLKATPKHRLLTPQGWQTLEEIIKRNLWIISYDPGIATLATPPLTTKPPLEELKSIEGFPNYLISNWGNFFIKKSDGSLQRKKLRVNNRGYQSVTLWNRGIKKKRAVHGLVAEVFIGPIPVGYVVDHLDTVKDHNYVTNLEIVSISENTKRASKYSRGMNLGNKIGLGFPDLQLVGFIKAKAIDYGEVSYGHGVRIVEDYFKETGLTCDRKYVQRIVRDERVKSVQVCKLTKVREFMDTIYDISVEEDESYITSSKFVSHNTPFGIGGFFHNTWSDSIIGSNGFTPIKLTWDMHPERDETWYLKMRNALGAKRTAQEIDGDFLSSGDTVFDLYDIKAIEDDLLDHPVIEKRFNGSMLIFHKPVPGRQYFIGADVATGRAKDYSAFSVMDTLGVEVACFKGRMSTNRFRDVLIATGIEYNYALLAPEANDVGEAVVGGIQERAYPNIYYTEQLVKEKNNSKPTIKKVPGWYTTGKTRPVILALLEEDIREDVLDIADPYFVNEAYTFIYDNANRPIAMNKGEYIGDGSETYSDDSIMAKAITNYIRRGKQKPIVTTIPK